MIAPEVLQFIEIAESETLLGAPEEIDSLLRAEAKVSEDTRAALVGTELGDRFIKAEQMADRALSIVVASDGKLKVMSRALDGETVSPFLAAAGALTPFDLLWAEFRSKTYRVFPEAGKREAPPRQGSTRRTRIPVSNTRLSFREHLRRF